VGKGVITLQSFSLFLWTLYSTELELCSHQDAELKLVLAKLLMQPVAWEDWEISPKYPQEKGRSIVISPCDYAFGLLSLAPKGSTVNLRRCREDEA
jgi:hypothetical protein